MARATGLIALVEAGGTMKYRAVFSVDDRRHRFELLVLPHLDAAYRFARWLTHSPSDADDVLQEATLRAFRGFDALRGSDEKAWLLTIVKNCYLTTLTQQRRGASESLPEEHALRDDDETMISLVPDAESVAIQQHETRTLDRLMSTLPEEHREVLLLREVEEMNYREIATVTNVPIGTVISRLARAGGAQGAMVARG